MSYNASTFCFSSVCGEIERLGGGIVDARAGAVGDAAEYENGPRPKAPDGPQGTFASPIGLVKLMRPGLVGLKADYF
jgi:hypothetical protein